MLKRIVLIVTFISIYGHMAMAAEQPRKISPELQKRLNEASEKSRQEHEALLAGIQQDRDEQVKKLEALLQGIPTKPNEKK
jgi:hypothetical protein